MHHRDQEQREAELALLSSDDSASAVDSYDLEANRKQEVTDASSLEPEYQTPTTLKFLWVGAYFGFSMALTIYNKYILGSVSLSQYPALSMSIF